MKEKFETPELEIYYFSQTDVITTSGDDPEAVPTPVPTCLAKGTPVTMADGSTKNIEDIVLGDEVLTFDHEAGCLTAREIMYIHVGQTPKRTFTLHFAGGATLAVVGDHALLEQETRRYVTLLESDAEQFIGKRFYSVEAHGFVELLRVTHEITPTPYYEIYAASTLNIVANGMLNVAADVAYMLNIYELDESLHADPTALKADIAAYGLFDRETVPDVTDREFAAWNMRYVNIVVGKGLSTMEEIRSAHAEYTAAKSSARTKYIA